MSLKQEIETWVQALARYDNNEFEEALKVFDNISDTSRILFNMGVIHATLGEHEKAVDCYQRAVKLDQYLAVAYFQQGVSNFLVGDFEEALANFNDTLLYLRGNTYIDYEQLGLKFRLFSCEVLFNRGLCYVYLQQEGPGMQDFQYAVKEKVTPDHDVIDDAIREKAEGYTVFSIPVGVVYRPNEAKVRNLKTKDYLGKARLVAASDRANAFTGFQGSELKRMAGDAKDDRPTENISFAATNLVKTDLASRSRQQSEPPLNRNVFPPTPPPENEKAGALSNGPPRGMTGRAASVKNPPARPILRAQTMPMDENSMNMPRGNERDMMQNRSPEMGLGRMGTMRSTSETRGPRDRQPRREQGRPQLYREMTPQSSRGYQEESMYEDVYDMYSSPRSSRGLRRQPTRMQQPQYIDEQDEFASDAYEDDSVDDGEFEMVGGSQVPAPLRTRRPSAGTRAGGGSGQSRKTEVRKIRVKVHAENDTRYIMIGPAVEYGDFEGRIREKFGIKTRLKIKMQDDGDMITMGDQDDLDMLISNAKAVAKRERAEMAKLEIWIQEQR
ncbi:putative nadph oxidase regulator [Phaeomoniella chlamydospora]|uniref:Putative nadph oxidase regulator n=1 Tax=Phaeomoniella chlamydospora TaxID=158046 RepID=A0A0G2GHZ8_PHACM|nr:putative nadph oxidase regulator [Phaeomoniella chlamydospora]